MQANGAEITEENIRGAEETRNAKSSEQAEDNMLEENYVSPDDSEMNAQVESLKEKRLPFFSGESWQMLCAPIGGKEVSHLAPLLLCLCALVLTGVGSWRCSYFKGATISFTGGNYGLWTLEDGTGSCQQWDVLFFSYSLGGPLIAARVFSMASILFGLGLLTTMAQASRIHAVSWFLGLLLFLLFIVSLSTTSNYNLWATFLLFTYVIFILVVRSLFIHPVHRKISPRGCKILGSICGLCAFCCLMTLVVLKSDFCTCNSITADKLEGRDPGDPCEGECRLGAAGAIMIVAPVFWIATGFAVIRFGIQADFDEERDSGIYAHYSRESITTRVVHRKDRILKREQDLAKHVQAWVTDTLPLSAGKKYPRTDERVDPDNKNITDHVKSNDSIHIEPPASFEDAAVAGNHDEESVDDRSRCKKLCCDYRVVPRNKKEKWIFWSFRILLVFLFLIYLFIVIVKIGSRVENTNAAKAPDTSYNFITDVVCGINPQNPSGPLVTFPTKQDAIDTGYQVAHCGACGRCSNVKDTKIYVDTRKTIAKTSKMCGVNVVLGSYEDVVNCLEDRIGFSRGCTECWADNMVSTARRCLFTCMTVLFTGFMANNNVEGAGDRGWLNQCLFCDEKLSGPAFVTCSGVARRRLGIRSEIERNPAEQCTNVDFDWLDVDWSIFGL